MYEYFLLIYNMPKKRKESVDKEKKRKCWQRKEILSFMTRDFEECT